MPVSQASVWLTNPGPDTWLMRPQQAAVAIACAIAFAVLNACLVAVAAWLVAPVAILGCLYLAFGLPLRTQEWFFEWNAAGLVVYFLYGMRKSRLARAETRA